MLHVGHFSFDALGDEDQPEHGYFSCIVDADSPKSAVERFTRHILNLMQEDFAFSHIKRVYVEDIIRVNVLPERPVVTLMQSSKGHFPDSISYSLPSAADTDIEAFGLPADIDRQEENDSGEYVPSEPMIDFHGRRVDRHAAAAHG